MKSEELKRYIIYSSTTGVISRIDRNGGNGSIDRYGYLIIKIKGKQYKAHRLAWLYHYGKMPNGVIDHINGNKLDNRICNLRDVKQAENVISTKRKANEVTGYVGIYKDVCTDGLKKNYTTKINKKTYRFYTIEDAVNFRKQNGRHV